VILTVVLFQTYLFSLQVKSFLNSPSLHHFLPPIPLTQLRLILALQVDSKVFRFFFVRDRANVKTDSKQIGSKQGVLYNYFHKHKKLHLKSNELYCSDTPVVRLLLNITVVIIGSAPISINSS